MTKKELLKTIPYYRINKSSRNICVVMIYPIKEKNNFSEIATTISIDKCIIIKNCDGLRQYLKIILRNLGKSLNACLREHPKKFSRECKAEFIKIFRILILHILVCEIREFRNMVLEKRKIRKSYANLRI